MLKITTIEFQNWPWTISRLFIRYKITLVYPRYTCILTRYSWKFQSNTGGRTKGMHYIVELAGEGTNRLDMYKSGTVVGDKLWGGLSKLTLLCCSILFLFFPTILSLFPGLYCLFSSTVVRMKDRLETMSNVCGKKGHYAWMTNAMLPHHCSSTYVVGGESWIFHYQIRVEDPNLLLGKART